jgi:hypothetical protein
VRVFYNGSWISDRNVVYDQLQVRIVRLKPAVQTVILLLAAAPRVDYLISWNYFLRKILKIGQVVL